MPQLSDRIIHIRSDLGTPVRVTAVFATDNEANTYLEQHPDEGVIAEAGGLVWIADNRDLGAPPLTLYFIADNPDVDNNRDLFAWAISPEEALAHWQAYYETTGMPDAIGAVPTAAPSAGPIPWDRISTELLT